MKIVKSKQYEKSYKKKIRDKHMEKEMITIKNIEELIIDSENLKFLTTNPLSIIYGIEKKKGDLKEIYTAKVNNKIRLQMKPIGEYPYQELEITEIEFLTIDDKHYGDG